jgi:hypothetical protein
MNHNEVNEGITCVSPPLDRFLSLGLIYSVNSTKSTLLLGVELLSLIANNF